MAENNTSIISHTQGPHLTEASQSALVKEAKDDAEQDQTTLSRAPIQSSVSKGAAATVSQPVRTKRVAVTLEMIGHNLADAVYEHQPKHKGGPFDGLPDWSEEFTKIADEMEMGSRKKKESRLADIEEYVEMLNSIGKDETSDT